MGDSKRAAADLDADAIAESEAWIERLRRKPAPSFDDVPDLDLSKLKRMRFFQESLETAKKTVKDLERELRAAQVEVGDELVRCGVPSIPFEGRRYRIDNQFFANKVKGAEQVDVCAALRAAELGDFVNEQYSTSGLKSWIREKHVVAMATWEQLDSATRPDQPKFVDMLPESMRAFIRVYEETKAIMVKG